MIHGQREVAPGLETAPAFLEAAALAQEITSAREKSLTDKIGRAQKRDRIWFGDIHDCDRHNFYSMAEGDQRTRWDSYVQAKLDAGREWEALTKRDLAALGYEPLLAGESVEIKDKSGKIIARGYTDLSLRRSGDEYRHQLWPVEMKQMQPHMWDAIKTWRDLLRSPWTRKYMRQLQLYMYGKNKEAGLFHLGDFQGHWKLIPVPLDLEFVEDVLQKIERATSAASMGTAPDRIPFDPGLCGSCQFAHVCIPDIKTITAEQIENNPTLEKHLQVREAHYESWQQVEKANAFVKKFFDGVKDGVFRVGDFIITRKPFGRTVYDLTEEQKTQYGVKKTFYKSDIERFQQPDAAAIYLEPKRDFAFDGE